MAACCCSLAGTAACRTCSYNPNAETPPPVKSYATTVTDRVLATGWKTNADRIRQMTDEELARLIAGDWCELVNCPLLVCDGQCEDRVLAWLKQEVDAERRSAAGSA